MIICLSIDISISLSLYIYIHTCMYNIYIYIYLSICREELWEVFISRLRAIDSPDALVDPTQAGKLPLNDILYRLLLGQYISYIYIYIYIYSTYIYIYIVNRLSRVYEFCSVDVFPMQGQDRHASPDCLGVIPARVRQ